MWPNCIRQVKATNKISMSDEEKRLKVDKTLVELEVAGKSSVNYTIPFAL